MNDSLLAFFSRLRAFFFKTSLDHDFDDELAAHIELLIAFGSGFQLASRGYDSVGIRGRIRETEPGRLPCIRAGAQDLWG